MINNTRTLVIPDIHTRIRLAESIIDYEPHDQIVFLGDYFDGYDDSLEITHQVAEWLYESMSKPNRIHLLGNHDLSYLNPDYRCSGYSEGKRWAIKNTKLNLNNLSHYYMIGNILLTHAGLSKEFYDECNYNSRMVGSFLDNMVRTNKTRLYNCSRVRGGLDSFSGILWCDFEEFVPIDGVRQIFGHTNDKAVRKIGDNYCIDTFGSSYAVIQNGEIEIKTFKLGG